MYPEVTGDGYFLIRCDLLYDCGKNDPDLKKRLAKFLGYHHQWKSFTELYEEQYQRRGKIDRPGAKINEGIIRDLERNGFYFGGEGEKLFVQFGEYKGERAGVLLDKPLVIDYNNPEHREVFFYFFIYRLSKIELSLIEEFLLFHLKNTFNGDLKAYKLFLLKNLDDEEGKDLLKTRSRVIEQWINNISSKANPRNKRKRDSEIFEPSVEKIVKEIIGNSVGKRRLQSIVKTLRKHNINIKATKMVEWINKNRINVGGEKLTDSQFLEKSKIPPDTQTNPLLSQKLESIS